MLGRAEAAEVALGELTELQRRVDRLTIAEWGHPTRLPEWKVLDLVQHLTAVIWMQAEAMHRTRIGSGQAPSWVEVHRSGEDLGAVLALARQSLAEAIERVPDGAIVPLPFTPLPIPVALSVLVVEYGFHRNDLCWAVGDEVALPASVTRVHLELAPAMMEMVARDAPPSPVTYRLVAPSLDLVIGWNGDAWKVGAESGGPVCQVSGDESSIALFSLGRIPGDHPALTLDDPACVANQFREYFRL